MSAWLQRKSTELPGPFYGDHGYGKNKNLFGSTNVVNRLMVWKVPVEDLIEGDRRRRELRIRKL